MRETTLSINERQFVLEALKGTHRLDGRQVYDFRKIKVSFGNELGHVEVQLGQTRVLCQVTCTVAKPFPDRPTEGFITFTTELSQMAAPSFEPGRPSELAIEIGRAVERGLRESRAIETEGLCIVAGEKVWSVRVDITILDHCGNMVDAAMLAATTALRAFRRPDVTVQGEEITIHTLEERDPVPLAIHHFPLTVTLGFFGNGELLVVDPSLQEERVMDGRMTLTMNNFRELCAVHKAGGVSLTTEQMVRCAKIAAVKVAEMNELITQALEAHTQARSKKLPTKETGRLIGANIVTSMSSNAPVDIDMSDAGASKSAPASESRPASSPGDKTAAANDEDMFGGDSGAWGGKN